MDNQNPQGQWQQQQAQQRQNWQNPQPQYQDQNGQWQPNPNYPDPNLGTVGFVEAIKICFSKYADFNGRAPRAEYWWFALFTFIVGLALGWIPIIGWLVSLGMFIPGLAVAWRRLHDIGKGGGWYFIGLIPLVGAIILLIWYCKEGEPHPNRFGPNPYGINDGMPPQM